MQKYFESELYKLPFTNKGAKFGSGKSSITWNPNIDTDTTPDEIIVDLAGTDIGTSIKISSVKLEENIIPTISDRDFVIATVASPTVIKEPEKPAEGDAAAEGVEGETPAEGAEAAAKDGDPAKKDDKPKEGADKKPDEKKPAEKKTAEKK